MRRKVTIKLQKRILLFWAVILCWGHCQAQTSKVNVTIDGPGVVDEYYMLSADGKKQVKLKAVPSKFLGNVTFDGWSGDATGTSEELTVDADKVQNIHATFTYHRPVKKYPLLNLKQSWTDMGKPMYYEMPTMWETQEASIWRGTNYLPVDYNRDGYMDYIQFPKKGGMGTDNHRENVRFWLGKPDGSFEEDPLNDNRILGTVFSIHIKYADFNDDGYPDFCSFSTGYDRTGSTGDYPLVIMSDADGVYHDFRYPEYQEPYNTMYGTFHGGTTGDFDNDGDIDILFWNNNDYLGRTSLYLENDGKGNFKERKASEIIDLEQYCAENSDNTNSPWFLDCEFIDVNNDGYNDLAFTGIDRYKNDSYSSFFSTPVIFWGSSSGKYGGANYSVIPSPRLGYAINETSAFYDFNGDGVKEIIVQRNADGENGTKFYEGTYLQICELINGEFVDKTTQYIPVEHEAFNKDNGEVKMWIENIEGTDYLMAAAGERFYPGLGTGVFKAYAIRNGVMESLEAPLKTKISSFDEGLPLYVDGHMLTDYRTISDGVNPVDTMAEHHWVEISDWETDGGNMWRINMAHRQATHSGRTCIRWNRDGQDPTKQKERQWIDFSFVSEVDFQKLEEEGYFLEFFIKNSDPDLSLNVGFETHDGEYTPDSFHGCYATINSQHVEGEKFTGEWQRVLCPLSAMNGDGNMKARSIVIRVDKGDLNNEFYLDDIRIRRLYESGVDDYDRAFVKAYLDESYTRKERTAQISSQEFKAMLKPLIKKFAPDSMKYFNSYITDFDMPLTRGMATCMVYYVARCIGAETGNTVFGEQPEDIFDGDSQFYDELLPHWQDPGEVDPPADMMWRNSVFGGRMTAWWWNFCHVSDYSGINVIALDKDASSFHWDDPLTWEDAICAITRLYDSLDPGKKVVGDVNGDGVVNVADIVELINGGGEVNSEEIKAIVNIIMAK